MKKVFLIIFSILIIGCQDNKRIPILDDGYITGAEGAQIYYQVMGSGQDSIVVIHGGPGAGMHSVLPSVRPLAQHYVLIFYDQRGGGKSELPADTTKLQPSYFVEDLEAVRQHFGLEKMNVLTHSFGSVLVAQYAQNYPEHLKRLVFHGATGPDLQQELTLRKLKASRAPPSPDTTLSNRASELLQKLLKGTASNPVETCQEYENINKKLAMARGDTITYKGTTCNAPPEAVHYYYRYTAQLAPRYYNGWDFTTKLDQLRAPLLVVYGKEDSSMIPAQRSWASSIPNGRLLLIPSAGKAAFSDNPGFVFPAIDMFFSGKWPQNVTP
ncbi:alpha/beta fold hydrolase [Fodinibius salsisoli]|uniref:Alpha/beta fold hydrolase n=1 Tax=Fodinibius salsisoli TaxID=2820877 RepID=A0ABT3PJE4_9BACT|nr:alpha/beta fold hydrolase [Fodinibius salsisoli]MCW9705878.1 alpha/beta fold hydrolase [Fodinibius salsisoli]